jgi:hypothetical protein
MQISIWYRTIPKQGHEFVVYIYNQKVHKICSYCIQSTIACNGPMKRVRIQQNIKWRKMRHFYLPILSKCHGPACYSCLPQYCSWGYCSSHMVSNPWPLYNKRIGRVHNRIRQEENRVSYSCSWGVAAAVDEATSLGFRVIYPKVLDTKSKKEAIFCSWKKNTTILLVRVWHKYWYS